MTSSARGIIGYIVAVIIGSAANVMAFEEPTHEFLNTRALAASTLDRYLKENLKIAGGVDQVLPGGTISKLIADAGKSEDAGWRFLNHFHNPLKLWHEAGLTDTALGFPVRGQSSLLWAQNPPGTHGWSWHDGRAYFHQALTARTKAERDQALANTFRAVGQVMHLIEDASVPAHVRSDAHPPVISGYHYETWADKHKRELDTVPLRPNLNLTSVDPDEDLVPIYRLFDTDQYTGNNPAVTDSLSVGIAEYTNAHFFSDDTMFAEDFAPDDQHYFRYPSKASVDPIPWVDPLDDEQYLAEAREGGIQHVVLVSWLYRYRLAYFPAVTKFLPVTIKDDLVFQEQAQHLVPRAIGYAAEALDYFFRGQMNLIPDPAQNGKFLIKNDSTEPMSGAFELYYDAQDGTRQLVPTASWTLSVDAGGASGPVTFIPPTSPAPKESGHYLLVFKGTQGAESGMIAGAMVTADADPPLFLKLVVADSRGGRILYWNLKSDREGALSGFHDVLSQAQAGGSYSTGDYRINCPRPQVPGEVPCELNEVGEHPDKIFVFGIDEPIGSREFSLTGSTIWSGNYQIQETFTYSDRWSNYLLPGAKSWVRGQARVNLGLNLSRSIRFQSRELTANWTYDYTIDIYLFTNGRLDQRIESSLLSTTGSTSGVNYSNFYYSSPFYWPLGALQLTGRYVSPAFAMVTPSTFHPRRVWAVSAYYEFPGVILQGRPDVVHARVDTFDYDGTSFRHLGTKDLPALSSLLLQSVFYGGNLVTGAIIE